MARAKNPGRNLGREFEERIQLAVRMIEDGWTRWQVIRGLKEAFNIGSRVAEDFLSHARQRVIEGLFSSTEEARAFSLARYQALMRDPSASVADKIKAQSRIDDILGLNAPKIVRFSGNVHHNVMEALAQIPEELLNGSTNGRRAGNGTTARRRTD